MNPNDDIHYDLSIDLTTYNPNTRTLTLKYHNAYKNGMNPEDTICKIKVIGKTKSVMFVRLIGEQYKYISHDESILLEIVK